MSFRVRIVKTDADELVDAVVRKALTSDKRLWNRWFPGMSQFWEDSQWDWDELIDLAIAMPARFEVYALEAESELQGLRMLEIAGSEVDDFGVHALRLATAPWNRPPVRIHYGVGSVLVGIAIQRSLDLGHEGRCYCESLPSAAMFHQRNGMELMTGLSPEGLARYRFTEQTGPNFLSKLKRDGLILWA
jgi:hypothetical protein